MDSIVWISCGRLLGLTTGQRQRIRARSLVPAGQVMVSVCAPPSPHAVLLGVI